MAGKITLRDSIVNTLRDAPSDIASVTKSHFVNNPAMDDFSARLASLRKQRGLTQKELAFAAGYEGKQGRIANYELGTRQPRLSELPVLAKALGISVSGFFELDDAENSHTEHAEGIVQLRFLASYIEPGGSHTLTLPRRLFHRRLDLLRPEIRVIWMESDEMRGEIERGDLIFIDPTTTSFPPEVDGIYAIRLGTTGMPLINRIRAKGDGGYQLRGSKASGNSMDIYGEHIKALQIEGLLVGALHRLRDDF